MRRVRSPLVTLQHILLITPTNSDEQSVMGALQQTTIQVAWAFGVCIASLVVQVRGGGATPVSTQGEPQGDLLTGLRDAFWMTGALAFASESHPLSPRAHSVQLRSCSLYSSDVLGWQRM